MMLRLIIALPLLSVACGAAGKENRVSPAAAGRPTSAAAAHEAQQHRESAVARHAEVKGGAGKHVSATLIRNIAADLKIYNCGCYFSFPEEGKRSNRHVFFEDFSEGSPMMNIGGRDVELTLIDSSEPEEYIPKVGEQFRREYRAGNIRVVMDFVVTGVCDGTDETCESTDYNVVITATEGDRIHAVSATGGCGC